VAEAQHASCRRHYPKHGVPPGAWRAADRAHYRASGRARYRQDTSSPRAPKTRLRSRRADHPDCPDTHARGDAAPPARIGIDITAMTRRLQPLAAAIARMPCRCRCRAAAESAGARRVPSMPSRQPRVALLPVPKAVARVDLDRNARAARLVPNATVDQKPPERCGERRGGFSRASSRSASALDGSEQACRPISRWRRAQSEFRPRVKNNPVRRIGLDPPQRGAVAGRAWSRTLPRTGSSSAGQPTINALGTYFRV